MARAKLKKSPAKQKQAPAAAAVVVESADAQTSRTNILDVATHEFSEKGLSGARIDEIAELTDTSKRMIYYYFRSKEGLYRAVLERCYTMVRQIDTSLELDALPPLEALRQVVRTTFDFHNTHQDFVRIVMNENIHQGAHIRQVAAIKSRSRIIINMLQRLIERGVSAGEFRSDLDPVQLHMSISALCFYNVSNRHTFAIIFHQDMTSAAATSRRREIVVDTIERWCRR